MTCYLPSKQLLVEIIDASSVITWDFDVCKGDVVFNIYHSKRAPQPPRKDPMGAHVITSPGGNNVQLIDKSWTIGQDYSMVECPLTCKEGESVQVSVRVHLSQCEGPSSFVIGLFRDQITHQVSETAVKVPVGGSSDKNCLKVAVLGQ